MFRQLKDPNLVEITGTSAVHCGIWRRVISRKSTWCILSFPRAFINSGDAVWRPVSELRKVRGQRIADRTMQKYLAGDKGMTRR